MQFDKVSIAEAAACKKLALDLMRWNHPTIRTLDPAARQTLAELLVAAVNESVPRVTGTAEFQRENGGLDRAREIFAMPGDGVGGDALYEELFGSLIEAISGGAGTAFIEDVDALHRGMPPETSPRLAA